MSGKVLALVVAFCFTQIHASNNIIDTGKAALKLAGVIRRGGVKVGVAYVNIESAIKELEKPLSEARYNLSLEVVTVEKEAKAAGKNISVCLTNAEEAQRKVNRNNFEACRVNKALNDLSLKLAGLVKSEVVLGTALVKCRLEHLTDNNKRKACVQLIINEVLAKVQDVDSKIDSITTQAPVEAKACAQKESAAFVTALEEVSSDLKACVQKA